MAKKAKVVVTPERVAEALKQIRRRISMGDLRQLRMAIEAVAPPLGCRVEVVDLLVTISRKETTGGFLGIGQTTKTVPVLQINKGAQPPVVIQLANGYADDELVIQLGDKLKPSA